MRRILIGLGVVCLLMMGVVACGESETPEPTATNTPTPTDTPTPTEAPSDPQDMADEALAVVKEWFGAEANRSEVAGAVADFAIGELDGMLPGNLLAEIAVQVSDRMTLEFSIPIPLSDTGVYTAVVTANVEDVEVDLALVKQTYMVSIPIEVEVSLEAGEVTGWEVKAGDAVVERQ